ncbi:MAG: hypothetical protein H7Y38_19635 [Armatimonadetes bacterium]|nr:hypothetical protein [Armatimonadota bacterium]
MNPPLLPTAFARLSPNPAESLAARLRERMHTPPRFYHTVTHIEAVVACVWEWTHGEPSAPLLAAALYHDAVYDARRTDNEALSATFCRDEWASVGANPADIAEAERLILATAHGSAAPQTPDETLLLDADLYVLGGSPGEYADYVHGVRAEYAHVPEPAWVAGRGRVLTTFLSRPRIFLGDWHGVSEREAAARVNLQAEHETLAGFAPAKTE